MSSRCSAPQTPSKALTIDVRSRRSERRLVVLALGAVALSTSMLSLPLIFAVATIALVVLGFWSQGWLGGADRLTGVSWLSDGSWILTRADQENIPATLSAATRIGRRWLWLRWHTALGQRSMLILKGDALPAEIRRLNTRLRLESGV